ncbi:hypothetical protein J5N97_023586 [Dioscorea zingiberensis]|uniref:DUF4378 domain-containing protein n=1 Tax=Dioscorea zingiberensis TaxID=325984 RepID=A0A9D5C5H8_9LILI|nr:hypothetical protein J5N97_023586 [Dioscorea zingiberensis]
MERSAFKWQIRSGEETAGCMKGLINLFDFRPGQEYPRNKIKLLKNFEKMHKDVYDNNEEEARRTNVRMKNVRVLIEKEMDGRNHRKEDSVTDIKRTILEKNNKVTRKRFNDKKLKVSKCLGYLLSDSMDRSFELNLPSLLGILHPNESLLSCTENQRMKTSKQNDHSSLELRFKHQDYNERVPLNFFLKKIMRSLRHSIGDTSKHSSRNTSETEFNASVNKKFKKRTLGYLLYKESFFHDEMVNNGDENETKPIQKESKTLGELFLLPECNSLSQRMERSESLTCQSSEEGSMELKNSAYITCKKDYRESSYDESEALKKMQGMQTCNIQLSEHEDSAKVLTAVVDTEDNNLILPYKYVRLVLEASGIDYNEISDRFYSSGQMLDPILFEETEISSSQLLAEQKLLFDCINEVLVEIHNRLFGCSPWIFIVKPNARPIPIGENFIQEVWKDIVRYLKSEFPSTLQNLVRNDLDRTWMNFAFEIENTVCEIGDDILVALMEEFILEQWI